MKTIKVLSLLALVSFAVTVNAQKWSDPKWDAFKLPEINFTNKTPETEGAKIYSRIVPDPVSFIQQHALWVVQTLYWSPEDSIPNIRKINYTLEDKDGISAKGGGVPNIYIFYSSRWVERSEKNKGDDKVMFETRGVLYHELTHGFQLEPQGIGGYKQGTEFWAFIEGMADAVRYQNGFFPVTNRKPGGKWMDGYQTTGFFLQWLTSKDPDFLRKFNRSTLEIIPWSFDKAMRHVLGEECGVDAMWNEYQEFLKKQ